MSSEEPQLWTGPEGYDDFLSGLSLLTMGPAGEDDGLFDRVRKAIDSRDAEAAEHLAAVLIVVLYGRGIVEPWMAERAQKLAELGRKPLDNAQPPPQNTRMT